MTPKPRKIEGKFYPLQNEEWLEAWGSLKPAEVQVLYYLRTLDPFGEKEIELGVSAIALRLGIAKSTVSKALKTLDRQGWIDLELIKVKVKLHSHRCFRQETALTVGNTVSCRKPQLTTGNSSFPQETSVASRKQPEPETLIPQESHRSKTYSDLIETLSEGERDRFKNFCQRQADQLPERVVLLESWSAAHFEELLGMYWKVYGRERSDVLPANEPDIDRASHSNAQRVVEQQIAQGLQDGRIKKLDRTFDGLWDREGNWWRQSDWVEKETKNIDTFDGVEINSSSQEES